MGKEKMDMLVQKIKETASLYDGSNCEISELRSLQAGINYLFSTTIEAIEADVSVADALQKIKSTKNKTL